ncbi:P-loop NTPase fold protein [Aliarcobacter lanthieri]|uniref:P-loop NTPase fold protein n=1 Tax=Aliarcobacter lanthieri TaxID=1355374 RepID=UPI003AAE7618
MFYRKLLAFTIIPIILYFLFPYIKDIGYWIFTFIDLHRVNIFILLILPTIILFVSYILCPNCYGSNNKSSNLSPDSEFKNYDSEKVVGVKNIINSHNDDTFFSLALIGDWGSGKSSFLKRLKKEIEDKDKDKNIVIYLNVWELEHIQNILEEIKKEFDNIVFRLSLIEWILYHTKSILVKNYFSLLSKYFVENSININLPFSSTIKDSKDDYNKLLKRVLQDKKIVLMLDELDRLESKEDVLNIFKIIRYLTSFDKVFTITGVDMNNLPKKGITLDYTHKIFNSKYVIPKITRSELLTFIIKKGSEQQSDFISPEEFRNILNTNISSINLCLIDFITTYREAKSILNDTYMFCNSLRDNPSFKEDWKKFLNFKLVLVLSILKSINLEFYLKFMNLEDDIKIKIMMYNTIKKNDKKLNNNISSIDKITQDEIDEFLKYKKLFYIFDIFDNRIETLDEPLYIYIHHNIYPYNFTEKDYEDFLNNDSSIDNKFKFLNSIIENGISNKFYYKNRFSILLIKRIYEEQDQAKRKKLIQKIFKNHHEVNLNDVMIPFLINSYNLNITKELFEYGLKELNQEDLIKLNNLMHLIINIDDSGNLSKYFYNLNNNSKKKYNLKCTFLNIKRFKLKEDEDLLKSIKSIYIYFDEEHNTFFEDELDYLVFNYKQNDEFEYLKGKKIKEKINNKTEIKEKINNIYKKEKNE